MVATVNPALPRVLIVDDDTRTARRFASMLEEDGFVVEVVADGAEAVARLGREPPPDAILTDLVMPHAGGIAVLGEARRRWRNIPVIFITGHAELLRGPKLPFDPSAIVFTKPIAYSEVSAALREALATPRTREVL